MRKITKNIILSIQNGAAQSIDWQFGNINQVQSYYFGLFVVFFLTFSFFLNPLNSKRYLLLNAARLSTSVLSNQRHSSVYLLTWLGNTQRPSPLARVAIFAVVITLFIGAGRSSALAFIYDSQKGHKHRGERLKFMVASLCHSPA